MSAKLMGQVWDLDLPRSERDVLLALADHADDDGNRVRPSVPHLAWKTDYSERQVQRSLVALKSRKIIESVGHAGGGRGQTPEYRLFLHRAPRKRPWHLVRAEQLATRREKGDMVSGRAGKGDTMSAEKGDMVSASAGKRVTSATQKGDICDTKRVTSATERVTSATSSLHMEPVKTEPPRETPGTPNAPAPARDGRATPSPSADSDSSPAATGGDDGADGNWSIFDMAVSQALGGFAVTSGTNKPKAFQGQLRGIGGRHSGDDPVAAAALFARFVTSREWRYRPRKLSDLPPYFGAWCAENATTSHPASSTTTDDWGWES